MEIGVKFNQWAKGIVIVIFGIIIALLLGISIVNTSYISYDGSEKIYYIRDTVIKHIVSIAILCLVLVWLKSSFFMTKIVKRIKEKECEIANIVLIVVMGITLFLVLGGQVIPGGDQGIVLRIANEFLQRDFSSLEVGGYLNQYPHQIGHVMLYMIPCFLFGSYAAISIQIGNALLIVSSVYYIWKLTRKLFQRNMIGLGAMIVTGLYLPYLLYVTFVYGNVLGHALSLCAIWYQWKWMKERKLSFVAVTFACIIVASLVKSNYLIAMCAIVIMYVWDSIEKKKWNGCILAVFLVICYLCSSVLLRTSAEVYTGEKLSQGIPQISWVAMGLQEGSRAPGWYNGYTVSSYKKGGYDTDIASSEAKERIKETLQKFEETPSYMMDFFTRKIESQWSEPSFQGFWINEIRGYTGQLSIVTDLFSGTMKKVMIEVCDVIQTLVYFGALLWVFFGKKKGDKMVFVLPILFIGGFLFHLVWEAKGQYTITYFILLIPYAVAGYLIVAEKISSNVQKRQTVDIIQYVAQILFFVCGCIAIGYGVCSFVSVTHERSQIRSFVYLPEQTIDNGRYVIMPYSDSKLAIGEAGKEIIVSEKEENNQPVDELVSFQHINLSYRNGKYYLVFESTKKALDVPKGKPSQNGAVQQYEWKKTGAQEWRMEQAGEDGYYIRFNEWYVLAWDKSENMVVMQQFTGEDNQIWRLERLGYYFE